MKFNELRLEVAVNRADVSGDPVSTKQRKKLAYAVFHAWLELFQDTYFPFTLDDVVRAAVRVRKRGKERVAAWQIAVAHNQWCCFWASRDKGPCSDEVEAGHVVARANGGGLLSVENGMIECRAHNNQRRDMSIEDYLASTKKTEAE